jgi:Raf kinase inhibitor-like YbhB/YbcL family protein
MGTFILESYYYKTVMNLSILFIMAITINSLLTIKSPAFKNNDSIPLKYTCDGTNINPALTITGLTQDAKSLVIIVDDPDAPHGTFDHWIMWNIPPKKTIEENSAPGVQGKNGKKENKYTGPCPPSGTHHYHFKIYALDANLDLPSDTNKQSLEKAMEDHIISFGELIGTYKK